MVFALVVIEVVCIQGRLADGGRRALSLPLVHVKEDYSWFGRTILTTLKTATETASELSRQMQDSVEELGRTAAQKIEEARLGTGQTLHAAASTVRVKGHNGARAIDDLAAGTADRLDATASYIERHDMKDAMTAVHRFGRHHLAGSLLAAAAIGFIAGSALARRTS